ncbi:MULTISPECIES: hypothetical protein [Virgibacillus]|uniref:Uncharacterized protein n=2 Tax=Virgibacillus TaxID=84406 RepID=A0A024Q7H9_9BACI|nr:MULTISPECIES: hypothetical protein [Virgibacillus]EQB38243.1 hypothetical protein M948_06605 [Virgibacillus sp. CM-4]GGJ53062.1 hypothetical protein GCM10007111_14080 [Virgibacillus kapii]CDQ38252.1 hypothetical protein BN990_00521 [Virgibacillus massiliensis]
MVSFLQVCDDTEKKLGRKLQEKEIQFLQWVYKRYIEEQPKSVLEYLG